MGLTKSEKNMNKLIEFLISSRNICDEYTESSTNNQEEKHNVFQIISDKYYWENFHSDIIRYFLDQKEKHREGNLFLKEFISMLNKKGCCISSLNYKDASVVREQGNIDVLIYSDSSKKAIIIENKIHDAVDQHHQLPNYYDRVSQEYCIDAIVYIPLDINKKPDTSTWTEKDKQNVKPLLHIIPAYSTTQINIVTNWIEPSILQTSNIDVLSTLRQYAQLIKTLNHNYQNTVVMEKFYNELQKGNNIELATSIQNMMNELPQYMAQRIIEKYRDACDPFSKVWLYGKDCVVFGETIIGEMSLKVEVQCSVCGYGIVLYLWEKDETHLDIFHQLVNRIHILKEFNLNEVSEQSYCNFTKNYAFTYEEKVNTCIHDILTELKKL